MTHNIISENKLRVSSNNKSGTYIFALYAKDKVVHVGKCKDIHTFIDGQCQKQEISFDRFTYTFMEGVQPESAESNLMLSVAINRLMPQHQALQAVAPSTVEKGRVVYQLPERFAANASTLRILDEHEEVFANNSLLHQIAV
ncbi:hypothetical protein [Pontibacter sp. SGAir0037]|uniref:hypothetical protein n=1 Tax=Pontibacter sp. SGAir0037 TaxID=2571030 RepID=UPI0010CD3987|nr:hypothetical protein [Pontibacter sp. SGAir0037]QCR22071.1 hypothetical protein C1N53_06770 [Pontibacter sp. SGAir0037]